MRNTEIPEPATNGQGMNLGPLFKILGYGVLAPLVVLMVLAAIFAGDVDTNDRVDFRVECAWPGGTPVVSETFDEIDEAQEFRRTEMREAREAGFDCDIDTVLR